MKSTVVGKSDCSNPQVLAADAKPSPSQLLVNALGHGVIIKDVQLCQINDGFAQEVVGCGTCLTSSRLADLRQASTQLLFSGNNRDRQIIRGNLGQALTYLQMAAEIQA